MEPTPTSTPASLLPGRLPVVRVVVARVAALAGLLVVIGVLIGPFVPAAVAAGAPLLWSLRRRVPAPGRPADAQLSARVAAVAARSGVGRVDVFVVDGDAPAGSLPGRSPAAVLVHADLAGLPDDEFDALVAHELGHVARRDFLSVLLASVAAVTGMLTVVAGSVTLSAGAWWGTVAGFTGGAAVAVLVSGWVHRRAEWAADRFAVAVCGTPAGLAAVLARVDARFAPATRLPVWAQRLVSTHPPTVDRIAALTARAR